MTTAAPAFFYDLGSPYAWLAAERVDAVLGDVEWVPVLLGGLFRATGRRSWGEGPGRGNGLAEVERRARSRGLGVVAWPEPWPNDGLTAMRAAVAAQLLGAGRSFSLSAFRTHFLDGRALSDPASIEAAAEGAGLDGDALLAATADPQVKARLRAQTDDALALGVFGVPSVVVGSAVFWGDDRLEEAAAALA